MEKEEKNVPVAEENDKVDHSMKMVQTVALVFLWICMGAYSTLISVALGDLRARLDVSTEEMTRVMALKSLGGLFGGFVGGACIDRYRDHCHLFIAVAMLVCGAGTMSQPWSTYLEVLGLLFVIEGICQGIYDTAGNTYIMAMWGVKANAPMHAIHFGYTVGTLLAPLIAFSFLSPDKDDDETTNTTMIPTTAPPSSDGDNSQIEIPYFIIGAGTILLSFVFFAFEIKGVAKQVKISSKKKVSLKELLSPGSCADGDTIFGATMVSLYVLYMVLITTISMGPLMMGFTYLRDTDRMDWSLEEAILWALIGAIAQMVGRGVTIAISHWCPIQVMLAVELIVNAVSVSLITFIGVDNKTVMYVGTAFYAFSCAPLWPGGFAWLDKYIIVYGIVVALATVGAGLAGFGIQWLNGYLYDYVEEESIFYTSTIASMVTIVFAVVMQILASRHGNRHDKMTDLFDPDEVLSSNGEIIKSSSDSLESTKF